MGWFVGMALLPFFKSQAHFLADNMWLPYCVCTGCAIFGGLLMLCIQRVSISGFPPYGELEASEFRSAIWKCQPDYQPAILTKIAKLKQPELTSSQFALQCKSSALLKVLWCSKANKM